MQHNNYSYPRDPLLHPHAKIVKQQLLDMAKNVAAKAITSQGYESHVRNIFPSDADNTRVTHLAFVDFSEPNERINVVPYMGIIKVEGDLSPEVQAGILLKKKRVNAFQATVKLLKFFNKYGNDSYTGVSQHEYIRVWDLFQPLVTLISKIEKYCVFSVEHCNVQEDKSKKFEFDASDDLARNLEMVGLYIFLKDEYKDGTALTDFVCEVLIASPNEALRRLMYKRNLMRKVAL